MLSISFRIIRYTSGLSSSTEMKSSFAMQIPSTSVDIISMQIFYLKHFNYNASISFYIIFKYFIALILYVHIVNSVNTGENHLPVMLVTVAVRGLSSRTPISPRIPPSFCCAISTLKTREHEIIQFYIKILEFGDQAYWRQALQI